MKFIIKHEIPGRLRVHFSKERFSFRQADTLQYYLESSGIFAEIKVYERTADAVVRFSCAREEAIQTLKAFDPETTDVPGSFFDASQRETKSKYFEKIVMMAVVHYGLRFLAPSPIRKLHTLINAARFIRRGIISLSHRRLEVPVLDAVAVTASIATGDHKTASSVMFLLDVGDNLEEWTHKNSIDDLARRMSLNIDTVWVVKDGVETQVKADEVQIGDRVIVRVGNIIPFDGEVCDGEAMVNQASMTGEAIPVKKDAGKTVFGGTVIEEGEITIAVTKVSGTGRFDKIVRMIEESEKLKSEAESKAEHLADKLVPFSLGGAALTYLLTRNTVKAVSVLMVDYSCAMKLAMPMAVLSAMREAGRSNITIKGGKFMEAISEADAIVFDKTGTLTKAQPKVVDVISFNGESPDELLREAACLEEHFPHSIANAVVKAAEEKKLYHEEFHTKVEYIVAHGIASSINNKRTVIGSFHFIFEDEGVPLDTQDREKMDGLPEAYSRLYYAKEGKLAAVILIEDPLRDEAPEVIRCLRELGIKRTVMMTGDSEKTAAAIAKRVGVDEYHSEVLPEEKAAYIKKLRMEGKKVIMVGDGINDSPALSEADVGIAVDTGADIARQIADVTIGSDKLYQLIMLKELSDALMRRIKLNYRSIVGVNTGVILLGAAGILPPAVAAVIHNSFTLALGVYNATDLL